MFNLHLDLKEKKTQALLLLTFLLGIGTCVTIVMMSIYNGSSNFIDTQPTPLEVINKVSDSAPVKDFSEERSLEVINRVSEDR